MSLSPEVALRVLEAERHQNEYEPSEEIAKQLSKKTLVMIVGPTSVGKTSVMEKLESTDDAFCRVGGLTTREHRPDDIDDLYDFLEHDDETISKLLDDIDARRLVQYAVHPSTKRIYATRIEDYAAEYNLRDTLTSVISGMRRLPFKQHISIALTITPTTWLERFDTRFQLGSSERRARLEEAASCLEWELKDTDTQFVYNHDDTLTETVKNVASLARGEQKSDAKAKELARQMLKAAEALQVLSDRIMVQK